MKNLKIYYISKNYINYLRQFDSNVAYNKKYRKMLEGQLTFLNNHKMELFKKIKLFQNMYRKGHLPQNVLDRCCNFSLLEEKFKEYNNCIK